MSRRLRCSTVYRPPAAPDVIEGVVLKCPEPISLLGDLDFKSGTLRCGRSHIKIVPGTVLCYPRSIGSTVGPYSLYALKVTYNVPRAIVCVHPDVLTVTGAVLFDIPLVRVDMETFRALRSGDKITILLNNEMLILE